VSIFQNYIAYGYKQGSICGNSLVFPLTSVLFCAIIVIEVAAMLSSFLTIP